VELFKPVFEAVGDLRGFSAPWFVCGGWAIDLFLGKVTREHDDVEIAIFRDDQMILHRHFDAWSMSKVVAGELAMWSADERLEPPVHEIHARNAGARKIEFLLNERNERYWIYRRDARVMLPLRSACVVSSMGVPILAPEVYCCIKASNRARRMRRIFKMRRRRSMRGRGDGCTR
jgi:hypothetical protein